MVVHARILFFFLFFSIFVCILFLKRPLYLRKVAQLVAYLVYFCKREVNLGLGKTYWGSTSTPSFCMWARKIETIVGRGNLSIAQKYSVLIGAPYMYLRWLCMLGYILLTAIWFDDDFFSCAACVYELYIHMCAPFIDNLFLGVWVKWKSHAFLWLITIVVVYEYCRICVRPFIEHLSIFFWHTHTSPRRWSSEYRIIANWCIRVCYGECVKAIFSIIKFHPIWHP